MKVITVSNIKGGVCKTTTAATLASGLNKRGKRVLAIDSDPQMNLTMCFMQEPEEGTPSLYHIYKDNKSIDDIKYEVRPGFDLVIGDIDLFAADIEFLGKVGGFRMLTKVLKKVENDYDYVVIDVPTTLGFLTLNAYMATDHIVLPMASEAFSLRAVRLMKKTLRSVEDEAERNIPVAGTLLTRHGDRLKLTKLLKESIIKASEALDTTPFTSKIGQSIALPESQLVKMDIFDYAPKSPVAKEYDDFITELLERIG